jgi:hypothetical protein
LAEELAERYPALAITPRNRTAQEELLQDIDLAIFARELAIDEHQERLAA